MKKVLFLPFLLLALASFCQTEIEEIFDEIETIEKKFQADNPIWRGEHPEVYPVQNLEKLIVKTGLLREQLIRLEALNPSSLSSQNKINRAVRILQLRDEVSEVDFNMHLITINAEGGRYSSPVFFLKRLPFQTKSDYQAYLKWLPSYTNVVRQEKQMLENGMKAGVLVPRVIVQNTVLLLEPWTGRASTNPFFEPLGKMPASISSDDQKALTDQATRIIEKDLIPAYKDLGSFLSGKYMKAAPEEVGVSALQNGKAYYENRVRHYTTLDISPDSVYNLGHHEVARIKSLMEEIIKDLDFEGSFADFFQFLRTDPQFYATSAEELLSKAAWLSKKAEGQLPRLFSQLYELPFTVEPVPLNIAPTYTAGRYVHGSRDRNTPGTYWVNTYDLPSRSLYTLPALTVHEAVPGHHLQTMIAAELEGLPDFRTSYYISAFGEGWGLYSEYLGEEMGMYSTPYEWFGRYTYEMWRACRLVVDVGIHYKGWTRQQAVDFMASNTALSMHEVNTEIDRYIGWPGQAVSYKIGELTIKALRAEAEEALGDKFDIQEFHKVILSNGSIPLTALKEEVQRWIDSKNE